jgi:RNA polymerase sigma factor (sigma-70 family)
MAFGEEFDAILGAAHVGAEWAWAALYRELAPSVLAYLRASGTPDPEDVLGDAFVQVVRGIRGFEGGERAFRAWIFAIARNRVIDDHRYRNRRPVQPVPPEVLRDAGLIGDSEEEALRALGAGRVRAVLSRLSPDQQDVLLLRILGGLTLDEVGRALRKTPGAVKSLQARGLAALRRQISGEAISL